MRWILALMVVSFVSTAMAEDKPAAEGPPPGPMSRPVKNADKKGLDALFKAIDEAWKTGDMNAVAEFIDFPVHMITDDSKGTYLAADWDRAKFVAEMGKMPPPPKDMKMSVKRTPHFLSDTLAVVVEDSSMSMGKVKGKWKGGSLVVNKDGKWKFKQMAEAGWGDTMGAAEAPPNPAPKAK